MEIDEPIQTTEERINQETEREEDLRDDAWGKVFDIDSSG
jgi:hypothetical protein